MNDDPSIMDLLRIFWAAEGENCLIFLAGLVLAGLVGCALWLAA